VKLADIYRVGHRKAVMALGAVVLVTSYALYVHAPFDQYSDRIVVILGLALGTHAYQQVRQPSPQPPETST
jgi:hypothetical protein